MDALSRTVRALSRAAATVAAAILVAMVCHILLEIVLRTFFERSTFSMDEFVGYGIAAVTYLGLGHALSSGALIRVDMLFNATRRRPQARRAIELCCAALTLAAFAVAIVFFWRSVRTAYLAGYTTGTMSDIPQWMPETVMLAGLVIFWLQLFVHAVDVARGRADILLSEQPATTSE